MRRVFKKTCIKEEKKRGRIHSLQHMGSRFMLRQGAESFMLGKYLSDKKNYMAAKETIGDGGGRKYASSQFSDQDRQDYVGCAE